MLSLSILLCLSSKSTHDWKYIHFTSLLEWWTFKENFCYFWVIGTLRIFLFFCGTFSFVVIGKFFLFIYFLGQRYLVVVFLLLFVVLLLASHTLLIIIFYHILINDDLYCKRYTWKAYLVSYFVILSFFIFTKNIKSPVFCFLV